MFDVTSKGTVILYILNSLYLKLVSGDIVQTSSGFGGPPQVSRRDSHDQIHMMTQRMKQVSIQSQLPMYQNGTYHDSRFQYDQAPSSYNERSLYFGGYYSATPHSNSYPNVVSRGKDGTVGKMLYRF